LRARHDGGVTQIPSFSAGHLNPRLLEADTGKAFPRLVYELLMPDRPDLVLLDALGKDGAIDLSETRGDGRTVVECKHVGVDGPQAATVRWREVATRLRKHLADGAGPTAGQAQYGPWYRLDPPIVEYVFAISSSVGNQHQRDGLRDEIRDFFDHLAVGRPHLAHLADLRVEVLDWTRLQSRIERRPHVAYRWFPATRPLGIVPVDEPIGSGTFRSYLQSGQLPYFSFASHRAGTDAELHTESELLGEADRAPGGLVITGRGGVGKTRLTLELGRLAQDTGWAVFRALTSFDRPALVQLAEDATPGERTLL